MKTTTEQLHELLSVAEQCAGPFQSVLHEAAWRKEFHQRFTPDTCIDLVRRLIRAEKLLIDLCVSERGGENV